MNGWLVTKAVFVKKRRTEEPVGTVNFILGKDKIYSSIYRYLKEVKYIAAVLGILSLLIALLVSMLVFGRYRKLYRVIEEQDAGGLTGQSVYDTGDDILPAGNEDDTAAQPVDESLLVAAVLGSDEDTPYQATEPIRQYREEIHFDVQKSIKDAIPVKKRRGR